MIDKKYYGNAVEAILITIFEKYCMGNRKVEDINEVINTFNLAAYIASTYQLKEIELIKGYQSSMNEMLEGDYKKYRIFEENNIYKLVSFV